jgi:hypothetical protein
LDFNFLDKKPNTSTTNGTGNLIWCLVESFYNYKNYNL